MNNSVLYWETMKTIRTMNGSENKKSSSTEENQKDDIHTIKLNTNTPLKQNKKKKNRIQETNQNLQPKISYNKPTKDRLN